MNRKQLLRIAAELKDLSDSLQEFNKHIATSYRLTLDEARAEVVADLVSIVFSIIANSPNQDRMLRQAWESANNEIKSNLGGHAKSKGYTRGRSIFRHMPDTVPPFAHEKIIEFAQKARDKGQIGAYPVAETLIALHMGKEIEKFATRINEFPDILNIVRSAVSTTWSCQGFRNSADPDAIAKIEARAQAFAKNLSKKAERTATVLAKADI